MKTYTIPQIRTYLQSCDSFGDALYFLSEEKIDQANTPIENVPEDQEEEE